ncbi:response regulator (plasmid) [Phyllobacterium sp. A18/5-2]|uniref:response regulator n=1 Tax=Phyllobacterium sp. A18/5-2 TaxID=2978392 RepID=UPI0021C6431E|nr:response regulator [Phyllobacterium sp. A18/5-2]UXN66294.1 response regulator [Phyllobacterium sp. A18/5-2]
MSNVTPLSVLLCEDEPLIKIELAALLRDLGHTVGGAASGSEALIALEAGAFKILIVDIELPDMSGLKWRPLHAVTSQIGMIFATGRFDVDEASLVEDAIMIAKPYGEADIADAIDRLLAPKSLR